MTRANCEARLGLLNERLLAQSLPFVLLHQMGNQTDELKTSRSKSVNLSPAQIWRWKVVSMYGRAIDGAINTRAECQHASS